jgi:deoxyribonuclease-4
MKPESKDELKQLESKIGEAAFTALKDWCSDEWVQKWAVGEPRLSAVDNLSDYFYFSRESRKLYSSSAEILSNEAKKLLQNLVDASDSVRSKAIESAKQLAPAEQVLLDNAMFDEIIKEEKIDSTIDRLVQSAKVGEFMGAYRLVFHPGFYSGRKPEVCMDLAKKTYTRLLERCEEEGIENFTFAPETTGKRSQLGNIDEIIEMCASFDHFEPTIDFAHVHARGRGILNKKEDYNCIFSKLEDNLDIDRLHCHFTTIEYTDKGEKKHHTLAEDDEYGPHIKDLLLNLIENDWKATIICETPLIDQDALRMKQLYDTLI